MVDMHVRPEVQDLVVELLLELGKVVVQVPTQFTLDIVEHRLDGGQVLDIAVGVLGSGMGRTCPVCWCATMRCAL